MKPAKLRVERFRADADEWDGFVRAQRGWTHFHLLGWKRIIEKVFGHECLYFAARGEDGHLAGVLPLVRVKSFLTGHYLVSMPFLNYGGPLGTSGAVRMLVERAVETARSEGATLLELRSRIPLHLELAVSHRKITVLLELASGDAESLWRDLKAKVRSQVRRPQKEGVSIRFGLDQVEPFFNVYSHHMRDLGTPTQSRLLFETLAEVFPRDVWFGCAYLHDKPVAGGCGFRWGHEFELTWASSLRKYNPIAPNMLLYWSFLKRAAEEGLELFNFGRCTPDGGTHRFKRQWGGRDETLWWYYHASGKRSTTPSPDDGAYSWGPRVWRHLPVAVANALGPKIIRYIP